MKKTIQNIHRTCISHASAIREKLEASEAEVARLKEALKLVASIASRTDDLLHEEVREGITYKRATDELAELAKSKSK